MKYFDLNAWVGAWPFRALRDNTPQDLLARLQRAGIERAAVGQIEAAFQRQVQPANEQLAAALEPFPSLLPMAALNPAYPHWQDDLRRCHEELGMRGVRLYPVYHDYAADSPEAVQAVAACKERGLPVFLPHRLEDNRQRHWMDPGRMLDLGQVADLIAQVPKARVVVTNARGLAQTALWRRADIRDAAWFFDLSLAEVHYVLHKDIKRMGDMAGFIAEGGAPHLVFGTHAPFSYPSAAVVKATVLPVDKDELKAICWGRAMDLLGVEA
ncbi:MAG: amidohydrolase family protein [Candidatus Latescibacteria bacterium]|nr:amidohydrolase family protein [Candidatus Latescibacterota bacterium]